MIGGLTLLPVVLGGFGRAGTALTLVDHEPIVHSLCLSAGRALKISEISDPDRTDSKCISDNIAKIIGVHLFNC